MRETLSRCRPILLTEFSPFLLRGVASVEPLDYLSMLVGLGYDISVIRPNGGVLLCSNNDDVIKQWRILNDERSTSELMHLDLIAHPI